MNACVVARRLRVLQKGIEIAMHTRLVTRLRTLGGRGYISLCLALSVMALFGAGAWQRRWTADDGFIVLRTVRNLLNGAGPVFNVGERVEVNTSVIWTYVVAGAAWISHARLEYVALACALFFSVLALGIGMRASARLNRAFAGSALMVPFGAIIYCALPQARDFATSGLETGLTLFWIASSWSLCTRFVLGLGDSGDMTSTVQSDGRSQSLLAYGLAFWLGLGPLVRPELAIYSAVLICFILWKTPTWKVRILRAVVFASAPVAYQIFRMGYYGQLVPNTAISKEATDAQWSMGLTYITEFSSLYAIWVPYLALIGFYFVQYWGKRRAAGAAGAGEATRVQDGTEGSAREAVVRNALVLTVLMYVLALVYIIYVARVGGDFMRGRMLLPALFTICLPFSVIPVTRKTLAGSLVVLLVGIVWSVSVVVSHPPYRTEGIPSQATVGAIDERLFYIEVSGSEHPVTLDDYSQIFTAQWSETVRNAPGRSSYVVWRPFHPMFNHPIRIPYPSVQTMGADAAQKLPDKRFFYVMLGIPGMALPDSTAVYDPIGLAYPEAAHTQSIEGRRIGHNKEFPTEFFIAGANGRSFDMTKTRLPGFDRSVYTQGVRFWQCRDIQELHESYTSKLTLGRFFRNFLTSWSRTRFRYDVTDESSFCNR